MLIDRHSRAVFALSRRLLRDSSLAEDVTQEAFLKFWEFAPRWKAQGAPVGAWLSRVAANGCIDRIRKRAREAPEEAAIEPPDEAPDAFDRLSDRDRRAAIESALARLPERQRLAIVLCHYQEISNIEAAAIMKISIEALESLLARARRSLRESLSDRREELMEGA